ncbi:MAG: dihydroorotate dehydrogenase electron transfer subunit [Planctomycetaceae bacterium]
MGAECSGLDDWLTAAPGMIGGAVQERGRVVEQVPLAHGIYRLRIAAPQLAVRILPGQFFMIRLAGRNDPLLGRPFALYDVWRDEAGRPQGIDFAYHVVGKVTGLLSEVATDDAVELWGPLGNGFPAPAAEHLICVGGGIGYTPFLAVAQEAAGQRHYGDPARARSARPSQITLCYGARSRSHRADLTDFADIPGLQIRIATDDGSDGYHGFVTDLLVQALDADSNRTVVYCCGPEPMMHAVARLCRTRQVPCWLSLEAPMACGFGACFSCVTKVRVEEEPGWDYRRSCVEGPIFAAESLAID